MFWCKMGGSICYESRPRKKPADVQFGVKSQQVLGSRVVTVLLWIGALNFPHSQFNDKNKMFHVCSLVLRRLLSVQVIIKKGPTRLGCVSVWLEILLNFWFVFECPFRDFEFP